MRIRIVGIDRIRQLLEKFPGVLEQNLTAAGEEAANEILDTVGLRSYPPGTAANRPPTPYYIRGIGMQYKTRNDQRSERYGSQWSVRASGYRTVIGNKASYSVWLGGERQASHMGDIGWRKLYDVAQEKLPRLRKIYRLWIERAIKQAGL